jgi:hypothetical protein
MNTTDGNAILLRLAASAMQDGSINSDAYSTLLVTYNYGHPGMSSVIYDFIRACGITRVSKRTLKLAEIAIQYFNNKGVNMTEFKDLYIACQACNSVLTYISEDDTNDSVTYKCNECDITWTMRMSKALEYATQEVAARGVFEEKISEPTREEEEWHEKELLNDTERNSN